MISNSKDSGNLVTLNVSSYSKALVSSSCTCLQEGMATDNKLFVAFFVETIERCRTLFLSSKYSCVFFTIETRNIYFLCSLAHKAMRMAAAMVSINKKAGTTYIMCGSCLCRVVVVLLWSFSCFRSDRPCLWLWIA